jgi:hypothetical protein
MYVGRVIEAWVDRYLDKAEGVQSAEETASPADASTVVVTENGRGPSLISPVTSATLALACSLSCTSRSSLISAVALSVFCTWHT